MNLADMLRRQYRNRMDGHQLVFQAADEIERLRAALAASESLKRGYFDEIERLRAELNQLRGRWVITNESVKIYDDEGKEIYSRSSND